MSKQQYSRRISTKSILFYCIDWKYCGHISQHIEYKITRFIERSRRRTLFFNGYCVHLIKLHLFGLGVGQSVQLWCPLAVQLAFWSSTDGVVVYSDYLVGNWTPLQNGLEFPARGENWCRDCPGCLRLLCGRRSGCVAHFRWLETEFTELIVNIPSERRRRWENR